MQTQVLSFQSFVDLAENKKNAYVLTFGHFTSIHPGHIRYLINAQSYGSELVIALRGDAQRPSGESFRYSAQDRATSLARLNIASYIVILNGDEINELAASVPPSHIILGTNIVDSDLPEILLLDPICKAHSIRLVYQSGEPIYASTDLLRSSEQDIFQKRLDILRNTCCKYSISKKILFDSLESLGSPNILVIGDLILDDYAACEALGISAEAPVVVVKELDTKIFVGGAGIVASHLKSIGCNCTFLSLVGSDQYVQFLQDYFVQSGINAILVSDSSRPTTYKKRYMVNNQKLFRVSKLDERHIDQSLEDVFISHLEDLVVSCDSIVVSDFNYGLITPRVLNAITSLASIHSKPLFGDIQCSSQTGSILKLQNFTILFPNEREARISLQDSSSAIDSLASQIFSRANPSFLCLKLGGKGFIHYSPSPQGLESIYIPALSTNPLDVTGAGDSILAFMSAAYTAGIPFSTSCIISAFVAQLAVGSVGNNPIKLSRLYTLIDAL